MLTEDQIQFLNKVCPEKWENENNVINVEENVYISEMNLTEIPVQFGRVDGDFNCRENRLTTLKGTPSIIKGYFSCLNNKLTTLQHGPKEVGGFYVGTDNKLKNLIGAPEICNGTFYCNTNQLTSLEGCPRLIRYNLSCINNPNLNILYGIGHVHNYIFYDHVNDLNEWIISRARANIFVSYKDIAEWIKRNDNLKFLLNAQQEIRQYFSPRILHLVDMGTYHNESKILDYKKFSRLC